MIVESPAKARTISKYLGSGYDVAASVGHVRDLPKKELGVDVEHGFEPKYETIRGKGKVITELKKKANKADMVILATDPDREGEAIAYHVAEQLGYEKDRERFQRVTFREITKGAVQRALESPGPLDTKKIEAQQARRILDRLVGYQVSPLLWKPIRPGLSAGRVQTVALRLICEREDEIRAFVQEEYWSITAHLLRDDQGFEAKLHKIDGKAFTLENEEAASAVVDRRGAGAVRRSPRSSVASVGRTRRLRSRRRRSSRRPRSGSASRRAGRCRTHSASTRDRRSAVAARWGSSPTCVPTPPASRLKRSVRPARGSKSEFGDAYVPKAPRLYGGQQPGRRSGRPRSDPPDGRDDPPAARPRSTWSPIRRSSTSSSGCASSRAR